MMNDCVATNGDGRGGSIRVPITYVAFATCAVQQLRPRYRLDVVGGRLNRQYCFHGTLRPSSAAAFV